MGNNVDSTLSVIDTGTGLTDKTADPPALFVVLEASRPHAGSSRHTLAGVERVAIGRGSQRLASRTVDGLAIELPDRWMSSSHAIIEKRLGRWSLTDQGSKNGTSVNGAPVRSQAIVDGDLIGVGHTLLRFRAAVAGGADVVADLDSGATTWDHRVLATLYPSFAGELAQAARLSRADGIPFLIRGESGTGKEVLASTVHDLSNRSGAFVAVNCGAIPANLIESELFGHTRGAFSGAMTDKLGLIRSADRGTLLLDEIGDLALPSQAALLRVLQEREVVPVGSARPLPVDLRVLSATHRDLDEMVARGEFRGDLYARLAGYSIELRPLRERIDDLGILIAAQLREFGVDESHPGLTIEAAHALLSHEWPMNIRELASALRAAFALAQDAAVSVEHLPMALRDPAMDLAGDSEATLRASLEEKLRLRRGNLAAVSRDFGKDRKQIQRWLKRFDIDPNQFR